MPEIKTMPEKDPATYSLFTWICVFVLSLWGGTSSYIYKVRLGHTHLFSISELIGEIVIAGFVGLVTFLACQAMGLSLMLSAVMVGIASHMGTRGLFIVEQLLRKKLNIKLVIDQADKGDGE